MKKVFKSKPQQYSFNFPYQVGTAGDGSMLQRNLGIDALEKEHKVQDYDIVIVATDGLWDNLFDKDIEECITENMPLAKSL